MNNLTNISQTQLPEIYFQFQDGHNIYVHEIPPFFSSAIDLVTKWVISKEKDFYTYFRQLNPEIKSEEYQLDFKNIYDRQIDILQSCPNKQSLVFAVAAVCFLENGIKKICMGDVKFEKTNRK